MLTARIQNQMSVTVALLLDVSIFDWTRLEATTNPSHTSKLWCVIIIEMAYLFQLIFVYSQHR